MPQNGCVWQPASVAPDSPGVPAGEHLAVCVEAGGLAAEDVEHEVVSERLLRIRLHRQTTRRLASELGLLAYRNVNYLHVKDAHLEIDVPLPVAVQRSTQAIQLEHGCFVMRLVKL